MKSAVFALAFAAVSMPAWAASCESLAALRIPNSTITLAEARPAGEFTAPGGKPAPGLPAFCRVTGILRPSADSDIRFEVWLPAQGWNGKFQGVGNGGYAGAISYPALIDAIRNGYATASTDTGHQDGGTSARWALNHPEKVTDFGYRSIHETAVTAKAVIAAYFGAGPKKSYFNSCSNGGRQALMEAQRYPSDYDGIIAGAPANYWTHLLSSAASGTKAMLSEPASYIPPAKLPALQAAVLARCDALDGVKDGVIENPLACHFDPAVLQCRGTEESDACLTAHQIATLKTVYGGLKNSKGDLLMPGLSPGGEAEPGGWGSWVTGPAPEKAQMFAYGTQFFKNMVYNNPDWDFKTFDADRDVRTADDRVARYLNSTDADLSAFEKRGGKLILYHGWADAAIPAVNAIDYYDAVNKKLGAAKTGSFVRLYMVPGMQHCAGGSGTSAFGQLGTPDGDRFHSLDAALEAWVEQGSAPAEIIAAKHKTNDPKSEVVRTRPLCPWPAVAKYKGTGSTDDAANFSCAKEAASLR
ncbi:MAG: tannase/feruloyl esterase family alpha/beta hydrolase [Acidobacteriota bacterium]